VSIWTEFETWADVDRKAIEQTFSLHPAEYALLVADLDRLQLIEGRRKLNIQDDTIDMNEVVTMVVDRWNSRVKYEEVGFTALGLAFLRACSRPKPQTAV
jgi:hypothetical protein